jgi:hypothetical protein
MAAGPGLATLVSRQDIVDSYLQGEISRRSFVRRLVAAGVALSAATAYAELLSPRWAQAATTVTCHYTHYDDNGDYHYDGFYDCHYDEENPKPNPNPGPPPDHTAPGAKFKLSKLSLHALLLTGRFLVKFTTTEAGEVVLVATLRTGGSGGTHAAKRRVIARGHAHFARAGTKKIPVKLTKKGRKALKPLLKSKRKRHHAHITVTATAVDGAGNKRTRRLPLKLR